MRTTLTSTAILSNIWGLLKLGVKVKTPLLILSITSNSKLILSARGLNRRIQEMGLGNNMLQGLFS